MKMRAEQISKRIAEKQHLILVETSVHNIPERLAEYDPDLFLVWNCKKRQYEIHSLANTTDTFCLHIPYNELDARVLLVVKRSDAKVRGHRVLFDELDKHNELLEKANESKRTDEIRGTAEAILPAVRKLAWEGVS